MNKPTPRTSPKVKYVLVPGWTTDGPTGERRFVPARELIRLYGLKPGTYRLAGSSPSVPVAIDRAVRQGLVPLYPDPTGKYTLPTGAAAALPAVAESARQGRMSEAQQHVAAKGGKK